MSEGRALYGEHTAVLKSYPEPLRPLLHEIDRSRTPGRRLTLANYLAAFVHPDYLCNLAALDLLDTDAKIAAMDAFEYCLAQGLTLEEQGALLGWLAPYLADSPGAGQCH